MPAKPTSATARETVAMPPPDTAVKCAVLTMRSSLFVSATSFRISPDSDFRLSVSETATRWMRTIDDDSAGKSVLCFMRRSRNSSVAWLLPASGSAAPSGFSQPCSAVCIERALS
jgi:hypothetical protein